MCPTLGSEPSTQALALPISTGLSIIQRLQGLLLFPCCSFGNQDSQKLRALLKAFRGVEDSK